MRESQSEEVSLIDPDPFLLAGLALQGAAVMLQLVQLYKQQKIVEQPVRVSSDALKHLESALEEYDLSINRLQRNAERGTRDPAKEVYEVGFRISLGVMELSAKNVQEYHSDLADTLGRLSAVTRWIGNLIARDPALAAQIGGNLPDAADRLNQLIAAGAPNSAILHEARTIREELLRTVRGAIAERRNN